MALEQCCCQIPSILIVDDDRDIAEGLSNFLEDAGHFVPGTHQDLWEFERCNCNTLEFSRLPGVATTGRQVSQ
jgi:hypothetical protein